MIRAILFGASIVAASAPVAAERFTRFSYHQYEGWVEDTGNEVRIRVIPFLLGPDTNPPPPPTSFNFSTPVGHEAPRMEMLADGRILIPFKIIRSGGLPRDALPSIAEQSGVAPDRLARASVGFVDAKYSNVTLRIANEIVDQKDLGNSELGGEPSLAFYVPAGREDLVESLGSDSYAITLDYEHGIADVRSLALDMTTEQVSQMWINAFKEVIKSSSSSGGKFLFLNFSKKVSRTRVKESVSSGATEQYQADTVIVLRDPTPEMEARVNTVLGVAQTTREQMMNRHQAAYTAALAAGNPKLANAHLKYFQALEAGDTVTDNGTALIAALAKIKDAEILQFLAAGFQMSESSASSYYRYDYSMAASASTTMRLSYREYLINSSRVHSIHHADRNGGSMRMALAAAAAQLHSNIFPTSFGDRMTMPQWATGVLQAVQNGNVASLRYAYSDNVRDKVERIELDAPIDADRNRLVHRAARRGSQPMLEIMLRAGSSPLVRNVAGDLPLDIAVDNGNAAAVSYLRTEGSRTGTLSLTLDHGNARSVTIGYVSPEENGLAIQPGTSATTISFSGYARLLRLRAAARLRFDVGTPCPMVSLGFPQGYLQPIPYGCAIYQDVQFERPVRIREGSTTRYRARFEYMDNFTGFALRDFALEP